LHAALILLPLRADTLIPRHIFAFAIISCHGAIFFHDARRHIFADTPLFFTAMMPLPLFARRHTPLPPSLRR